MDWVIITVLALSGAGVGAVGSWILRRFRPDIVPHPRIAIGATAALWLAVALCWSCACWPSWWLPVPLVVAAFSVPLALTDLRQLVLPNILTWSAYPAVACAVAAVAIGAGDGEIAIRAGLAGAIFAGAHAVVHAMAPASLGAGDVKLAGSAGIALGAVGLSAMVLAACVAGLVTLILSVLLRFHKGHRVGSGVPHGPGLLAATCLVALLPGSGIGQAV